MSEGSANRQNVRAFGLRCKRDGDTSTPCGRNRLKRTGLEQVEGEVAGRRLRTLLMRRGNAQESGNGPLEACASRSGPLVAGVAEL